ncbi:hypothetical protein HPP92_025540 [Vanilla planifolia]|uniref:Uncharacterized protein n=1 Tax=Vanilla planifolia TaxID=51239 RepID=A0A835UB50_VANPL|nr:hypothetical protein HPP92_025540 [Vanilla planifolia]
MSETRSDLDESCRKTRNRSAAVHGFGGRFGAQIEPIGRRPPSAVRASLRSFTAVAFPVHTPEKDLPFILARDVILLVMLSSIQMSARRMRVKKMEMKWEM